MQVKYRVGFYHPIFFWGVQVHGLFVKKVAFLHRGTMNQPGAG